MDDTPERVIDIKSDEPKEKNRSFISSVKRLAIFIILLVILALAFNYFILKRPLFPAMEPIQTEKKPQRRAFEDDFFKKKIINPFENKPVESKDESGADDVIGPKPSETPAVQVVPAVSAAEVEELKNKISGLEAANRNLVLYFAARDVKSMIADPVNFSAEIGFMRMMNTDNPELTGKIDILVQSATNMKTPKQLSDELDAIGKKMRKEGNSFSENVQYALGDLVRVSKVKGEVEANDYDSIIERAKIALNKTELSTSELKAVADDVAKLGVPAENWVKEVNNLIRVLEVCDYIISYSKAKVVMH